MEGLAAQGEAPLGRLQVAEALAKREQMAGGTALVLLGDPRQLDQPRPGWSTRPAPDVSALGHRRPSIRPAGVFGRQRGATT